MLVLAWIALPRSAWAGPGDDDEPGPRVRAGSLLLSPTGSAPLPASFSTTPLRPYFGPPGGGLVPTPSTPASEPEPEPSPTPAEPAPNEPEPTEPTEDEEGDIVPEQPRGPKAIVETESTLLDKRTIPPFWIYRNYDTHTTRALTFPPLFVHRSPKPGYPEKILHADLSFTFAYYAKQRQKTRWMNPLVLFFYGRGELETSWAALPLLMGYRKLGEQFNFGQFPFVWWWGNKYVKNLFILPFHYHKRAPDQRFAVSGLLFWYGNKNLHDDDPDNDRRHFVAAPVFWRFQKGLWSLDVSPLWFAGRNELTGVKHRTLLPFFHWQSREFGNRRELWTLLWIQRRDQARDKQTWAIPPLMTFNVRTRQRSLLAITPLVWRNRNELIDRSTWVALIGGAVVDPQQHVSWVAPLWWRFADKRNHTEVGALLPLAAWKRSPQRFALHTPAFSFWRNRAAHPHGEGGGGGSLPLLTWVHVDPVRSRQLVLGGLFWRFSDRSAHDGAGQTRWGVGPLAYRTRIGADKASFGIPPLLTFTGRAGERSYQVVTPLFWHVRNRSEDPSLQHDTWAVPPAYFQKRAQGFRAGLVPVFLAANEERYRYAVLPWLLFGHVEDKQEQTERTVWPLFVRTKTPTSRVLGVAALAWDVRRDVDGVRHRDTVVFPLWLRHARGDTVLNATLLGGARRTPDGLTWVGTLAYGFDKPTRRGGGFLPLVHHENRYDAAGAKIGSTSVVFPLVLRDRRPEQDFDIWTPLVWRSVVRGEKPRANLAVVPFYFGQRQPGGVDVDASLIVFYSRDQLRRTHTLVAGPYWHRLTRKKLTSGLAPLAYWEDSVDRRLLVVAPLIVSIEDKQKGDRTTIALPLWFDRIQPNGRRTWMAFPFVVGTYRRNDFTKAGVLPPLYYDIFRLRKNFRFTGVVPFLFRYQKGGFQLDDAPEDRYTLWGSFPLFFYGKDGKGRVTHSALALYWWDRSPDGFRFYTLLGGVQQRPGKLLEWYAPLVYRKVTNNQHTTFIWPFLAYHKGYRKGPDGKRYKDISTTWVLPPLYVGRRNEDRGWWQSTLLVWQFRRPHKVSTAVIPPIFFLQDSYQERRLHWLLPLYIRDNKMAEGEAWTSVFPALFVSHRDLEHTRAVQFPLLWHFDEVKRRVTIGGFLWYDIRNKQKGTATQVVPALYVRRETPERIRHVIGPGLATWRREAPGNPPALHWRALFWIIGGGNEDGQRYFWLFGAKIKLKPKPLAPREDRKQKRAGKKRGKKSRGEAEPTKPEAQPSATPAE